MAEATNGRSDAGGGVVEVCAEVSATPATVWRCLTESALLSRWLEAAATIDPHAGGAVRVDFSRYGVLVEGVVDEVAPGAAIAFTWGVTSGKARDAMPPGSTRVRITVAATPGGTEVTLRHAGLRTEKEQSDHVSGWAGYLANLASLAPVAAVEGGPEALWDRWFAAWEEPDASARRKLLARCIGADATFRDTHAEVRGLEAVSQWIDACREMFPGVHMRRDGAVLHTRGSLLVEWVAAGPGGAVVARGVNHGRVAADGLLSAVEGFWRN